MDRREFVKTTSAAVLASACAPASIGQLSMYQQPKLKDLDPLAINMWDFAWMMRHYKGGGMEDWDKALDELVERGYNALRVDCFPQFVAAGADGEIKESFYCPKRNWRPALWDNQFSITIEPRKYLVEFLTKCHERNIYLGLSSWFLDFATGRVKEFRTVDDLVRAWDETLTFIESEGLLKNVIYVDLLNEYPLWNGYSYVHLNKKLDKLKLDKNIGNVSGGSYDFLNKKGRRFNQDQVQLYSDFLNELITKLSAKWPSLDFMASQTNTLNVPWQDLDVSQFDVLDVHAWFVYNVPFSESTNYFQDIHRLKNDMNFGVCNQKIKQYWKENKKDMVQWMEDQILLRKAKADTLGVPYGNTEGWGTVMWMDHPDLDWDFTRETGIACAELGSKHGYSFNCTSNFNHPHFGLWDDIAWHKEVTSIIRNG